MNFVPVIDWKQKNLKVSHSTQLMPELLPGLKNIRKYQMWAIFEKSRNWKPSYGVLARADKQKQRLYETSRPE